MCSIYVAGLDVVELDLIVGGKKIVVKNNDDNLWTRLTNLPDLNIPWLDKNDDDGDAFGASFSTDGLTLPGDMPLSERCAPRCVPRTTT